MKSLQEARTLKEFVLIRFSNLTHLMQLEAEL